jgi:hypothetical protein
MHFCEAGCWAGGATHLIYFLQQEAHKEEACMIAQLLLQRGPVLLGPMEVLAGSDGIIERVSLEERPGVTLPRIIVVVQLPNLAGYLSYHPAGEPRLCEG